MWRFLCQLANAVQYLHTQRPPIIHRDLKPDNILGKRDPKKGFIHWKIADFGIARVLSKNALGEYYASSVCGTPIYMAPEVLKVRKLKASRRSHTIRVTPSSTLMRMNIEANFAHHVPGPPLHHLCRPVVPGRRDLLQVQQAAPLHLFPLRGAVDGRPQQPRPTQVRPQPQAPTPTHAQPRGRPQAQRARGPPRVPSGFTATSTRTLNMNY